MKRIEEIKTSQIPRGRIRANKSIIVYRGSFHDY